MKHRLLALLLSFLLVFSLFPTPVLSAATTASGTLTDTITWSLSDDGTLTISGTGEMPDYTDSNRAPWHSNRTEITSVVVENGVTSVGDYAFADLYKATSISIPDGVTYIGSYAFSGCSKLTSINIPESVTSIGSYAFYGCSSLTSIVIPECVTYISSYAFKGCTSLTSIAIPDGVTSIYDSAFQGCSSLASINIPESVTSIGWFAFSGCSSLTSIVIPESVTSISRYAFQGCSSLTSVTIPEGVTSIDSYAFSNCTSLASINIPESVTSIGSNAFDGCSSLTSIVIPEGVTSIYSFTFSNCTSLASINIPEGVTSISSNAFADCSSLKTVYIPHSLTTYGTDYGIPFRNSTAITDIHYGGSQAEWEQYNLSGMFESSVLENATIHYTPADIASGTLSNGMSWVISEDGTLTISGTGAMPDYDSILDVPWVDYREKITSVVVEAGITHIGGYAFRECSAVASVSLPQSVTSIGEDAFFGCSALDSITLPENLTTIGSYAFTGCAFTTLSLPESVTTLDVGALSGTKLTTVTLPKGLTAVSDSLFSDCASLTSVTIPEGVTSIGGYAFQNCIALASITIPEGVTHLGAGAFNGNHALKTVYLPKTLATYETGNFSDSYPFCNVLSITDVYYNGTKEDFKQKSLYGMFTTTAKDNATFHFAAPATFSALPAKTVYAKGESLDLTGLSVTSSTGEDITASTAATGFDSGTIGKQTVTLTCEGVTATYDVYVFGFTGASLTLEGKVDMNFYASFPGAGEVYTPGALLFTENPTAEQINAALEGNEVLAGTLHADDTYIFIYDDIAAKEMNDLIYAVPVAKLANGTFVVGKVSSMSVAQYVQSAFETYEDETLRTMLVDMLNYGAAAQEHFAYRTDALANSYLTAAQQAMATQQSPATSSSLAVFDDALTSDKVTLTGASLYLENELSINIYASIEGTPASAELLLFDAYTAGDAHDEDTAACAVKMTGNGSRYMGSIANIPAKYMRRNYFARVHVTYADGSEAYSGILRYSAETYAHTVKSGDYSADTKTLVDKMMRYGDSAAVYFGVEYAPAAFTVTFDAGEGKLPAGTDAFMTIVSGKTISALPTPTAPASYSFAGWYDGDTLFTTATPVTSDLTLTAKYVIGDIIDENFIILGGELLSYNGSATDVVVPEGVTKVNADVFRGNTDITSVTLPSTVRTIEANAFRGCTNLTAINLPEGMTRIEEYTFYGCTKLTGVTFPSTLQYIGRYAFFNCDGLTELVFNEGLAEMGTRVFEDCDHLTTITFPTTLKTIPSYAFASTSALTTIKWAEGLETIGSAAFSSSTISGTMLFPVSLKEVKDNAFYNCDLTGVIFRKNLETIGDYAFDGNALTTLTFNQNHALKTIGRYAFRGHQLTTLTLPDSLTSIGSNAFYSSIAQMTVYCAAVTPPALADYTSLHDTSSTTVSTRTVNLYVPAESVDAYKAASVWKLSKTINPYDFN